MDACESGWSVLYVMGLVLREVRRLNDTDGYLLSGAVQGPNAELTIRSNGGWGGKVGKVPGNVL